MTELLFLGLEIFLGMRARSDFAGDALHHLNSGALQGLNFFRIVREQTHTGYAQCFQNLRWEREVAIGVLEAQAFLGFDGAEARIRQSLGCNLRPPPAPPSYLSPAHPTAP